MAKSSHLFSFFSAASYCFLSFSIIHLILMSMQVTFTIITTRKRLENLHNNNNNNNYNSNINNDYYHIMSDSYGSFILICICFGLFYDNLILALGGSTLFNNNNNHNNHNDNNDSKVNHDNNSYADSDNINNKNNTHTLLYIFSQPRFYFHTCMTPLLAIHSYQLYTTMTRIMRTTLLISPVHNNDTNNVNNNDDEYLTFERSGEENYCPSLNHYYN